MNSMPQPRHAARPDDGPRTRIELVSDPEWATPLEQRLQSALYALRSYGLRAVLVEPVDGKEGGK